MKEFLQTETQTKLSIINIFALKKCLKLSFTQLH